MQVHKERFEDSGEQDEEGSSDYCYAGFIYRFVVGQDALVARQYDDRPDEAWFMRRERKRRSGWSRHGFDTVPYGDRAFRDALQYLQSHEGITQVKVLVGEYVTVDLDRIKRPLANQHPKAHPP